VRGESLAIAVAIVLLGFGLRAAYYHEGYGHPDEPITVEVIRHMRPIRRLGHELGQGRTVGRPALRPI